MGTTGLAGRKEHLYCSFRGAGASTCRRSEVGGSKFDRAGQRPRSGRGEFRILGEADTHLELRRIPPKALHGPLRRYRALGFEVAPEDDGGDTQAKEPELQLQ